MHMFLCYVYVPVFIYVFMHLLPCAQDSPEKGVLISMKSPVKNWPTAFVDFNNGGSFGTSIKLHFGNTRLVDTSICSTDTVVPCFVGKNKICSSYWKPQQLLHLKEKLQQIKEVNLLFKMPVTKICETCEFCLYNGEVIVLVQCTFYYDQGGFVLNIKLIQFHSLNVNCVCLVLAWVISTQWSPALSSCSTTLSTGSCHVWKRFIASVWLVKKIWGGVLWSFAFAMDIQA